MRKLLVVLTALAALQLSPAFAVERDVIERATLAFSEQLELTSSTNGDLEWIAEDAVYQYPLNDINVKLRVETPSPHICAHCLTLRRRQRWRIFNTSRHWIATSSSFATTSCLPTAVANASARWRSSQCVAIRSWNSRS